MCVRMFVGKRMTARAFVQLIGYWFGRLHLSASVGLSNDGFFDGNIAPTNALAFFLQFSCNFTQHKSAVHFGHVHVLPNTFRVCFFCFLLLNFVYFFWK